MSIVTKTGDSGTTGLMYNRRVPKCNSRIEACGAVDELNAAMGLARAAAREAFLREGLLAIQKNLIHLMGELATSPEDRDRYLKGGFLAVTPSMTSALDALVRQIEEQNPGPGDWATPGANPAAAALDFARTVCRRAERRVSALQEAGQLSNPEIMVYLNRLSDLLWLMARWAEVNEGSVR